MAMAYAFDWKRAMGLALTEGAAALDALAKGDVEAARIHLEYSAAAAEVARQAFDEERPIRA